ncbi:hypothetical protein GE061_003411 [Apolygus lucorum]|uniref:Uncharacterized protein n=1 Tax=Apolygus lucorum TaxID=248454 RepID=A0A8S9X3G9_APOLU|nr:hypothetical protein GE061_003411 [Apolygus lucorum]
MVLILMLFFALSVVVSQIDGESYCPLTPPLVSNNCRGPEVKDLLDTLDSAMERSEAIMKELQKIMSYTEKAKKGTSLIKKSDGEDAQKEIAYFTDLTQRRGYQTKNENEGTSLNIPPSNDGDVPFQMTALKHLRELNEKRMANLKEYSKCLKNVIEKAAKQQRMKLEAFYSQIKERTQKFKNIIEKCYQNGQRCTAKHD